MFQFNIWPKILSMGCLLLVLSGCTPQRTDILNTSCPEFLMPEKSIFSSSLYFTKNDGPYLYVFRGGKTYRIDDFEITPFSGIHMSPDGDRILHYVLPPEDGVDLYGSTISIINLPLPSTQTDHAKTMSYPAEWPEYRGSGGWLDSQTAYFSVLGNIDVSEGIEMVVMNSR